MLIRIVIMSFDPELINDFIELFYKVKHEIEEFEGCNEVKLMKDLDRPAKLVTVSKWDNKKALDNYRESKFFELTWSKTKTMFTEAPSVFSIHEYQ